MRWSESTGRPSSYLYYSYNYSLSSSLTFSYIQSKYMPLLNGRVDGSCALLARVSPRRSSRINTIVARYDVRLRIGVGPRTTLREKFQSWQEGFPPLYLRLHISITLLTIPHRSCGCIWSYLIMIF